MMDRYKEEIVAINRQVQSKTMTTEASRAALEALNLVLEDSITNFEKRKDCESRLKEAKEILAALQPLKAAFLAPREEGVRINWYAVAHAAVKDNDPGKELTPYFEQLLEGILTSVVTRERRGETSEDIRVGLLHKIQSEIDRYGQGVQYHTEEIEKIKKAWSAEKE